MRCVAPNGIDLMETEPAPATQLAVIVGAGLSGIVMAITLARKGFRVEVHEAGDEHQHDESDGRIVELSPRATEVLTEASTM
jgi:2-polyprenyl-6-methoxyphenol hydroxylase-like FAD-dependent oxidoreductase